MKINERKVSNNTIETCTLLHILQPLKIIRGWYKQLYIYKFGFLKEDKEQAMAPHSSTLAWKIPWMEEDGRLQSMGSLTTSLSLFTFMHWRRKWQPTPVFLPGESWGLGSLLGCRLWGRTESDTTEVTQQQQQGQIIFCASLTPWTWVWASSGSWWWTGKPGVLQSMKLQSWTTERLNWTEGKIHLKPQSTRTQFRKKGLHSALQSKPIGQSDRIFSLVKTYCHLLD